MMVYLRSMFLNHSAIDVWGQTINSLVQGLVNCKKVATSLNSTH